MKNVAYVLKASVLKIDAALCIRICVSKHLPIYTWKETIICVGQYRVTIREKLNRYAPKAMDKVEPGGRVAHFIHF